MSRFFDHGSDPGDEFKLELVDVESLVVEATVSGRGLGRLRVRGLFVHNRMLLKFQIEDEDENEDEDDFIPPPTPP